MRRMSLKRRMKRGRVLGLAWAALWLLAGAGAEAREFGTRCQRSYQNGWQNTLSYMYARCGGFNNALDDATTKLFYFDLTGTGSGFTFNDGLASAGGVDSVDVFYVGTHGGRNNTDARLTLWQQNTRTFSTTWRFGNNSDQVRIFSQYACKTLAIDDFSYSRWINAFRGGMQVATGSHDLVWDGYTTDETGRDYAHGLLDGKSVNWAWLDGNGDWYHAQDVAVYVTGTNLDNCLARLHGMDFYNISDWGRLFDSQIGRMCAYWITDN